MRLLNGLMLAGIAAFTLAGCGGGGGDGPTSTTPPQASLTAVVSPTFSGLAGDPITLDGSKSTGPAGKTLTYSWTITQKVSGSIAFFEGIPRLGTSVLTDPLSGKQTAETSTSSFCGFSAGTYAVQLKVSDGSQSTTANSTITLGTANRPNPRDATKCEVENLKTLLFASFEKNMGLKVPASFKLVTEPKWSYYASIGKPSEGAITFDFDASNLLGVPIRSSAICPMILNSNNSWTFNLLSNLQMCVIN